MQARFHAYKEKCTITVTILGNKIGLILTIHFLFDVITTWKVSFNVMKINFISDLNLYNK